MKITKAKLKELIKEELDHFKEAETLGTGAGRKVTRQQALDVGKSDISGIERAAIVKLQQQLLAAAKSSNIATGTIAQLMKRLSIALDKEGISGDQNPEELEEINKYG